MNYHYQPQIWCRKGKKVHYNKCTRTFDWNMNAHDHYDDFYGIVDECPRMTNGRFPLEYDWDYNDDDIIIVKDENGRFHECELRNLSPCRNPCEIDFDDWKVIYGEIERGSLYTASYYNSFGIDARDIQDIWYGYEEYVCLEEVEDNPEEFAQYAYAIEW